ncbi:MAG: 5-formyltetrahydrofolate cyclo-ligase [Bacteroidota bacterium]
METYISKKQLRKKLLSYRRLLSKEEFSKRNNLLISKVENYLQDYRPQKIHLFLSIKRNQEPNILKLANSFWSKNIQIVVSKTDFLSEQMKHYMLTENTILEESSKGIPEPKNAKETSIVDLDIFFVPLLMSDREGYRIGYGGGYYDRLLKETKAVKVGLSLSSPVDKIVQREDWDMHLDYLITPFKIYHYG